MVRNLAKGSKKEKVVFGVKPTAIIAINGLMLKKTSQNWSFLFFILINY